MSEFQELVNKYPLFSFNDNPSKRNKDHSLLMIENYPIWPENYNHEVLKQYKKCYTWNSKIYDIFKDHPDIKIEKMNGFPLFDNYNSLNENEFILIEEKIPGVSLICRYRLGSTLKGDIINKRYEVFSGLQIEKHCYGKIPYMISYYKGQIGEGKESYPSSKAKLKLLNKYRYNLCFENCYDPLFSWDYVTEKIFDCFKAKCAAIYYGCYNIEEIIPSELYIDYRKFEDINELNHYLRTLPDDKYEKMINDAYEWEKTCKLGNIKDLIENILEKGN